MNKRTMKKMAKAKQQAAEAAKQRNRCKDSGTGKRSKTND